MCFNSVEWLYYSALEHSLCDITVETRASLKVVSSPPLVPPCTMSRGVFCSRHMCACLPYSALTFLLYTLHFGFGFCSALAGWLWKNDDVENRWWRWQVCWWLRIKLLWGHPMLQGTLLNSNRKSTQIHKYKYTNTQIHIYTNTQIHKNRGQGMLQGTYPFNIETGTYLEFEPLD